MDEKASIHCCLVMRKSRVAHTKFVSVQRLELTAVALSGKVSILLRKELTSHPIHHYTDSQMVLEYINNDSERFISNRVQLIQEHSEQN